MIGSEPASADRGITTVHHIIELAPEARAVGAVQDEVQSSSGTSSEVVGLHVVEPRFSMLQAKSKPSPPTG